MTEEDELAEVEKWFAGLGYGMVHVTDEGFTWAHLTRRHRGCAEVRARQHADRGRAKGEAQVRGRTVGLTGSL